MPSGATQEFQPSWLLTFTIRNFKCIQTDISKKIWAEFPFDFLLSYLKKGKGNGAVFFLK